MKPERRVPAALLFVFAASGCGPGARLPEELTFEGRALERVADWSSGAIAGVVFVPPGETLETASLQIGILVSEEHGSGVELHDWVMEQYRKSPISQWYESTTAGEACKVGLGPGPRPFAALHTCRSGSGVSACAEVDERIGDDVVGRCLNRSSDCWDELCFRMWGSWRDALEAELRSVLESR